MGTVNFSTYVAGLALDTIGGSEKLPVVDGSTPKHMTPDLISDYVIDQIHGADTITSLSDTHQFPVFTSGDEEKIVTGANVIAWVVDALEALDVGSTVVAGDWLLYSDSGTLKRLLVSDLTTLVNTDVLDFSTLTADTPAGSDLFAFNDGAAKKVTLTNLETKLWSDFATYVSGLDEQTTVTATDKIYILDGGSTPKWVDPDALSAYFNVTDGDVLAPITTTETNIPQWSAAAKTLTDGLAVVTTVRDIGSALDTAVPTEQAVRELVGAITELDIAGATDIGAGLADADLIIVDDGAGGTNRKCAMSRVATYVATAGTFAVTALDIDGATDIGAGLADADLIIVDDGGAGTNRKSAVSRIWTYITGKIQGLTAKTTPVSGDILMIQDSADSNNLKELTVGNLTTFVGAISNLDIDGGTDIGAALADADLIIVDDGGAGTNRKAAVSRIWDYIVAKIQGTVTKATPVDADILMIQDSANSNTLTELTIGNLWDNRYAADMLAVNSLATAAWMLDEDNMASNSATKVPSQQSVKAYVDALAGVVQNNFAATSAPTVNNDTSEGYAVGSRWVNVVTDAHYECADATDGAAVWTNLSQAAAGWDGDITDVNFATGSDIGADLADGDQIVIADNSDSGNPKRSAMSRVKTYTDKQKTVSYASNQTLTTAECNGYVVYVTGAATITLPAVADGMSVTVITIGAVAVSIDPNASDKIWLDGVALDDGDKITNGSTAGDIAVLTYYSADGWHAATNGWTDGGA